MPYLSVHFREKTAPDGEQVHFAISRDGLVWNAVNGGRPVLTASLGEKGCRDIEIVRTEKDFVILTTDLAIARRAEKGPIDWKHINSHGSKALRMWRSPDLISFTNERLVHFGRDDFGCMWAPEVFFDGESGEYVVHWGSTVAADGYSHMSIYCSRTRDFETFSYPEVFFSKKNEILDSHLRKIGGKYHLFYKNSSGPAMNMHAVSGSLFGPYEDDEAFGRVMGKLDSPGAYEAPSTLTLPDGRWVLLIDFFGCEKNRMGYVPFVSPREGDARFERDDALMKFPYGFKHGGFIPITEEEYDAVDRYYNGKK